MKIPKHLVWTLLDLGIYILHSHNGWNCRWPIFYTGATPNLLTFNVHLGSQYLDHGLKGIPSIKLHQPLFHISFVKRRLWCCQGCTSPCSSLPCFCAWDGCGWLPWDPNPLHPSPRDTPFEEPVHTLLIPVSSSALPAPFHRQLFSFLYCLVQQNS